MQFTPTELEFEVMRALDAHQWYPPAPIAEATGFPVDRVRSALAELRRFGLVISDGRLGAGVAGRYTLTVAGEAAYLDTLRRRTLESAARLTAVA